MIIAPQEVTRKLPVVRRAETKGKKNDNDNKQGEVTQVTQVTSLTPGLDGLYIAGSAGNGGAARSYLSKLPCYYHFDLRAGQMLLFANSACTWRAVRVDVAYSNGRYLFANSLAFLPFSVNFWNCPLE